MDITQYCKRISEDEAADQTKRMHEDSAKQRAEERKEREAREAQELAMKRGTVRMMIYHCWSSLRS
jgi:hypothetical protein